MKQEEEIILEQNKIRNTHLESVFKNTLEFNNQYINFLKSKIEEAKKLRDEIINGR